MSDPLDRFFNAYYRRRPVHATFTGIHTYDDRLPDWSPDGLDGAIAEMRELHADLTGTSDANGPAAIDCALAADCLELQLAELDTAHSVRGNPALWTGEAIFGVVSLLLPEPPPDHERIQRLCARLESVSAFLDHAPAVVRGPCPSAWSARATRECHAGARLFRARLTTWGDLHDLPDHHRQTLAGAGRHAADALMAFARWLDTLETDGTGACGEAVYDRLLRVGHRIDASVEEILRDARDQLDRERAALDTMVRAAGYDAWPAVEAAVQGHHPTAASYLDRFGEVWEACRAAATAADLVTWPEGPVAYRPIPAWAREAASDLYFLHYRSPAPFGRPAVTPYLVPPLDPVDPAPTLAAVNDYVIKTNHVVHHGAIGHHVQNLRAYAGPSRIGRVAAVDTASRISMFCGGSLAEGWACYATDLMAEEGFLTPLEAIAHQHNRLKQAARAVLDISLHAGRASPAALRELLETACVLSPGTAAREVDRAAMFPGTSVMYWLGTEGIHRLRRSLSARPGFSRRRFHDKLLGYGAIPVALIARLMSQDAFDA